MHQKQRHGQLSYANDVTLQESQHFIALVNAMQGRSHLIVREPKSPSTEISNDLGKFDNTLQSEFWHLIQKLVSSVRIPCWLCHHYGGWRSAPHFHVHIVTSKSKFAEFASKKTDPPTDPAKIIAKIESTEERLVQRHLTQFKKDDIQQLLENKPEIDEDDFALTELNNFNIELDPVYPWVKFVPKEPLQFSKDQLQVVQELENYRKDCYETMHQFSEIFRLTDFRIWLKLAGDPLEMNKNRDSNNQIYGIITVFTPDYYKMNPNGEAWLQRYKEAKPDILACI